MRRLVPFVLLGVLSIGAGLGALTSFQSSRPTGVDTEYRVQTCTDIASGSPVAPLLDTLTLNVPASMAKKIAVYSFSGIETAVAVGPADWKCGILSMPTRQSMLLAPKNGSESSNLMEIVTATGMDADVINCPYSDSAFKAVAGQYTEAVARAHCTQPSGQKIIGRSGRYLDIANKATQTEIYGAIGFSSKGETPVARVAVCASSALGGKFCHDIVSIFKQANNIK